MDYCIWFAIVVTLLILDIAFGPSRLDRHVQNAAAEHQAKRERTRKDK